MDGINLNDWIMTGWVIRYGITGRNNLRFMPGCCRMNDGARVCFRDQTGDGYPDAVGYAILHENEEGVYCECYLNNTERAKNFRRKIRFVPPKSFGFCANQIRKKISRRNREQVTQCHILWITAEYDEIEASKVDHIQKYQDENNKEEVTG